MPLQHANLAPWRSPLSFVLALSAVGCMAAPDEQDDADEPVIESATLALDESPLPPHPDDGKACYIDGPKERKGRMEGGMCCYDTEDGNACIECIPAAQCQMGGGAGDVVARLKPPRNVPPVVLEPSSPTPLQPTAPTVGGLTLSP